MIIATLIRAIVGMFKKSGPDNGQVPSSPTDTWTGGDRQRRR